MNRAARKAELLKLIGWNLRRLRLSRDWSQEHLALEAGIDTAYLSRLERADGENPTVAALDRLAAAVGVELIDLLRPKKPSSKLLSNMKAGRKVDPNSKRQQLLKERRRKTPK